MMYCVDLGSSSLPPHFNEEEEQTTLGWISVLNLRHSNTKPASIFNTHDLDLDHAC